MKQINSSYPVQPSPEQLSFYNQLAEAMKTLTAENPKITNQDCVAILCTLAGMCIGADPPERRDFLRALARDNMERSIANFRQLIEASGLPQ